MGTFVNASEKVSNQDIESCPKWFSWDVQFGVNAETFKLMDIPEYVVILDGYVDVTQAGNGTTNTLDVRLNDGAGGNVDVLSAVNLQTTGSRQFGTVNPETTAANYPRTAADAPEALICAVGESGTTTTPPIARISLLMYRLSRPGTDSHPRVTPG